MDIDENGKFIVSKKAINLLSSIETQIAIISIAGQYRTGKSFLLNRFAGQQRGFAIGPSTNPCTKGIWIWGEPIQISENLSVILLDTEGLRTDFIH
jgi:GTPase Era involved in 16S rRNA processing